MMYTSGMDVTSTIPQPHPALDPLIYAIGAETWAALDPKIVTDINGLINGTHTFCWAHHTVEAAQFSTCGECFHGWDTADQLLDEDLAVAEQFWPSQAVRAPSTSAVFVCPACSHDL